MKEKQIKYYQMFEEVIGVMDKHLNTWKDVKELSKSNDRFVRNFKKLSDYKAMLDIDLKPVKSRHEQLKAKLIEQLEILLGPMSVYAADSGNKDLKKVFSVKSAKLRKMSDSGILSMVDSIVQLQGKASKKKKLSTLDYGLTSGMITVLNKTAEEFTASLKNIRVIEKDRKKSEATIEKLIQRNRDILKSRIDKFVSLFEHSGTTLYDDYVRARSLKPKTVKSAAQKPVAKKATPESSKPKTTAATAKSAYKTKTAASKTKSTGGTAKSKPAGRAKKPAASKPASRSK